LRFPGNVPWGIPVHISGGNGVNQYGRAVAALVLATFLWGSTFSFAKILVVTVPPMYLLAYRFLLSSLLMFLLFPRTIISEFSRGIRDKQLLAFSMINICAIGLQTYGIQYTTASNAGFITAFSVVLVPILRRFHFNANISQQVYLAFVIALGGLYAVSFGLAVPESVNRGDFFVFLCAIFYGYYIVILQLVVTRFSGATTMFFSFGLTSVACLVLGICLETRPQVGAVLTAPVTLNLLGLVVPGTVVAYLLMAWGQKHVAAEVAALVYTLEPLFAFLIAWVFLHESLLPWQMAGAGLVVLALIIGVRSQDA